MADKLILTSENLFITGLHLNSDTTESGLKDPAVFVIITRIGTV